MGTLGLCQAERAAGGLAEPRLAEQVVTGVLHTQLDDTTWPVKKYGCFLKEGGSFTIQYYLGRTLEGLISHTLPLIL